MDIRDIREKVKQTAAKAVESDKAEQYESAIKLYELAAGQLQILKKNDPNPYTHETYNQKGTEYLKRAKELKALLDAKKNPKKIPAKVDSSDELICKKQGR